MSVVKVRIPKDIINDYKEKILFGLSIRQLVSLAIGLPIVILVNFYLSQISLNSDLKSIILFVVVLPIFLFGFYKKRGMYFEQYIVLFIKYKLDKQIVLYESRLFVDYFLDEKGKQQLSKRKFKLFNNKIHEANIIMSKKGDKYDFWKKRKK